MTTSVNETEPSYEYDISVVIPCLNEAKTIQAVVREAFEGIRASGLKGEVVVSDNGSTDGSQELATAAGARVNPAPIRGYGAALHFGILATRGRFVIFGDADMSYDFTLLPRFKDYILEKDEAHRKDLVLGSRLGGVIEPGAMPFLNRYLGTPVLNLIIRLFFGLHTSDCNSGMRLVRRSFYQRLPMRAPGMEWASELLIKSAIMHVRYAEVPIVLRPDQRGRAPHLRRWRDGWRHLKSIVLLSPNRLVLLPSAVILLLAPGFVAMDHWPGVFFTTTVGVAGIFLGLLVKLVLHADEVRFSKIVGWLIDRPFAEFLLAAGVLTSLVGAGTLIASETWMRTGLLATTVGALTVLTSFAWGVLVTHCLKTLGQK